jgi:hypothetical protein
MPELTHKQERWLAERQEVYDQGYNDAVKEYRRTVDKHIKKARAILQELDDIFPITEGGGGGSAPEGSGGPGGGPLEYSDVKVSASPGGNAPPPGGGGFEPIDWGKVKFREADEPSATDSARVWFFLNEILGDCFASHGGGYCPNCFRAIEALDLIALEDRPTANECAQWASERKGKFDNWLQARRPSEKSATDTNVDKT